MNSTHLIRFDPSGSPVAVNDAGALHDIIKMSDVGNKFVKIYSIGILVRELLSEIPAVNPRFGLFLSKNRLGDSVSQGFKLWNSSTNVDMLGVFYSGEFTDLISRDEKQFIARPLTLNYSENIHVALVIENNTGSNYSNVVRVHVTLDFDIVDEYGNIIG